MKSVSRKILLAGTFCSAAFPCMAADLPAVGLHDPVNIVFGRTPMNVLTGSPYETPSDAEMKKRNSKKTQSWSIGDLGGAKLKFRTGPESDDYLGDGGWRTSLAGRWPDVGPGDINVGLGVNMSNIGIPKPFVGLEYKIRF